MAFFALITLLAIRRQKVKVRSVCHPVVQKRRISSSPVSNAVCQRIHVVQAGQDILMIANIYSTTVSTIQGLNTGVNVYSLNVGYYLKVPAPCEPTYGPLYMDNVKFKKAMIPINGSASMCFCYMAGFTDASYCESYIDDAIYYGAMNSKGTVLDWSDMGYIFGLVPYINPNRELTLYHDMRVEGYTINGKTHYVVRNQTGHVFDPARNLYTNSLSRSFQKVYNTW